MSATSRRPRCLIRITPALSPHAVNPMGAFHDAHDLAPASAGRLGVVVRLTDCSRQRHIVASLNLCLLLCRILDAIDISGVPSTRRCARTDQAVRVAPAAWGFYFDNRGRAFGRPRRFDLQIQHRSKRFGRSIFGLLIARRGGPARRRTWPRFRVKGQAQIA